MTTYKKGGKNWALKWDGKDALSAVQAGVQAGSKDLAEAFILEAQQNAEQLQIRDTGHLIDSSWHIDNPSADVYISYTDAEYALYNEYGTKNMLARPFMRPALDTIRGLALITYQKSVRDNAGQFVKTTKGAW